MERAGGEEAERLLTVIVPYRNRREYLGRSLRSIVAQGCRGEFDLILVDNGSDDGGAEICREVAQECGSECAVHIVMVEEKRDGSSMARNCGLSLCRTKYVYFFDSDDDMSEGFVGDVIKEISEHGDTDVLVVRTCEVVDGVRRERRSVVGFAPEGQMLSAMLSTQAVVFRTEWLRAIGGWDERLRTWSDWELGVRTLLNRPLIRRMGGGPFHSVYVHADSITGTGYSSRTEWIMKALEAVREDIGRAEMNVKRQGKLTAVLAMRCAIASGMMKREGAGDDSSLCMRWGMDKLMPGYGTKVLMHLLRWYTAQGGRGAWRLALMAGDWLF